MRAGAGLPLAMETMYCIFLCVFYCVSSSPISGANLAKGNFFIVFSLKTSQARVNFLLLTIKFGRKHAQHGVLEVRGWCILTAWQTLACRVWFMPPTKTPQVREMWKQRLTNMCQNLRLTRTDLESQKQQITELITESVAQTFLTYRWDCCLCCPWSGWWQFCLYPIRAGQYWQYLGGNYWC